MTDTDKAIWTATYAASFVAQFHAGYGMNIGGRMVTFEQALSGNAEQAIALADAAVAQLRDWEKDEGPSAIRAPSPTENTGGGAR